MIIERVYKTHDNKADVLIAFSDSTTPLQGVTRITCALSPSGVLIDSGVTAGAIVWTAEGVITFDFGAQAITGLQHATLVAYDSGHVNGQRLSDPKALELQQLDFLFID